MKVYIIGTGMDQRGTLTLRGQELIEGACMLAGAGRMLAPFAHLGKKTLSSHDPGEITGALKACALGHPDSHAAVLMSGDTGFYSGARALLEHLREEPDLETELVPGISSLAYFCAALGTSMEDIRTISLHGRDTGIAVNVKTNRRTFILLGGRKSASDVCGCLCGYGMGDVRISIGENLGTADQRILKGTAAKLCGMSTAKLSVLLAENDSAAGYLPSGIPDECFIRGKRPMTKSDIRAIAAAALGICRDDICWDIGCGTGSVSVEMAYRCTGGRVLAFDRDDEACALTKANAVKFGCDNIIIRREEFPQEGSVYERPDRVFVGGSGGQLRRILTLAARLSPRARIVVTAVTLDTLYEARSLFCELFSGCRIRQISSAEVQRTGHADMLRARNPVFIIENAV